MSNPPQTAPLTLDGSLLFLQDLSVMLAEKVTSRHPSRSEHRLVWNSPSLSGHASQLRFDSGLELVTASIQGAHALDFELMQEPSGVELEFFRSPSVELITENGEAVHPRPGRFCLSRVRAPTLFRCRSTNRCDHDHVGLQLTPERLMGLLPEGPLPLKLERVLDSQVPFAWLEGVLSSRASRTLDAINQCTYDGPLRELFLEERALELLMLALDDIGAISGYQEPETVHDATRLECARATLLEQLEAPPSLARLARHCGLNERKLKEGFKARFGTTVFGFVRRERMARAHGLLRQRRSVTDVAQSVGYSNPSKFAAAFRRQFGFAPSAIAQ